MRNKFTVVALLLFLVLIFSDLAFSGVTGKIAGMVKDKQTGEALIGANVIIEGTTYGAATDVEGYYFIINIPPGKYRVKAMMMGYKTLIQNDVQVVIDLTTKLDFSLEQTVLEGEIIEITAERPLIEKDVTSSSTVTTSDQIDKMPVSSFSEVLVTTPGFVESGTGLNREINVRGGRTNELAFMIDGFYVEDPLMGGMGSDVANVGISELAVMTGTFNAEYGEAMSGVLNIVTKEGGSNYSGRVRFFTDKNMNPHSYKYPYKYLDENGRWVDKDGEPVTAAYNPQSTPGINIFDEKFWERRTKEVSDFNTFHTEVDFGGPIPLLGMGNSFFIAGDALDTDTYLGWTGQPYRKERRANAKLALRPFNSVKLVFGAVGGQQRYRNYSHTNKYTPQNLGTNYDTNLMLNGTLTHQLSAKTFYTIKSSIFSTHRAYYRYKAEDFFSMQDENGDWQIWNEDGVYTGLAAPSYADQEYEFNTVVFLDSVWTSGGGAVWEDRDNKIISGKFDLTSQITRVHQIKLGFELKETQLSYHYVSGPYRVIPNVEKYEHKPIEGSVYLQDKMEFENLGIVVNAGVRLDYMDTRAKYIFDPLKPTAEYVIDPLTGEERQNMVDADKKLHISPRLGFAHPIMDKAVLHFAYGHFYQVPQYSYLFLTENLDDPNYPFPNMAISQIYTRLGNANLKPEKTIAYEMGVATILAEDISLDVTFFYKNIYDYTTFRRYQAVPVQYHRFINQDYANAKGVEVTLKKRFSNYFGGQVNYTLSKAEGNASDVTSHWNDWYNFSVNKTYPPKKTINMPWDQTHTVNFVIDVGKPGVWGINLLGNYGSGLPYTPLSSRGLRIDEPNSARKPWTMTVNMRATRTFKWSGYIFTLYADVDNLLNKKNVYIVHGSTGKPDINLNWDYSEDWIDRPYYYGPPRTFKLGLSAGF
ncbi:MAG TPA: TonB-dependent receptor [bacterium]|nr:TonB-dependent receptor [bacterium]